MQTINQGYAIVYKTRETLPHEEVQASHLSLGEIFKSKEAFKEEVRRLKAAGNSTDNVSRIPAEIVGYVPTSAPMPTPKEGIADLVITDNICADENEFYVVCKSVGKEF